MTTRERQVNGVLESGAAWLEGGAGSKLLLGGGITTSRDRRLNGAADSCERPPRGADSYFRPNDGAEGGLGLRPGNAVRACSPGLAGAESDCVLRVAWSQALASWTVGKMANA